MTILSGPQIRDEVGWGTIEVEPYDEKRVQPNSIDLTLGRGVRTYSWFTSHADLFYRDTPRTPKKSDIVSSEIQGDSGPLGPIGGKHAPALDSRMKMGTNSFD